MGVSRSMDRSSRSDTSDMGPDEVFAVLRRWLGRRVVAVVLAALPETSTQPAPGIDDTDAPPSERRGPAAPRPYLGVLTRREMWPADEHPELAPEDNAQLCGDVDFFSVLTEPVDDRLVNPAGITISLYRELLSGSSLAGGNGLRTVQGALVVDFWIDD